MKARKKKYRIDLIYRIVEPDPMEFVELGCGLKWAEIDNLAWLDCLLHGFKCEKKVIESLDKMIELWIKYYSLVKNRVVTYEWRDEPV